MSRNYTYKNINISGHLEKWGNFGSCVHETRYKITYFPSFSSKQTIFLWEKECYGYSRKVNHFYFTYLNTEFLSSSELQCWTPKARGGVLLESDGISEY